MTEPMHLAPEAGAAAVDRIGGDGPAATTRIDRAAVFRRLAGAALDRAYARASVILGDRLEAEDAVHDAAEKAWRSWGSLRDPGRFDQWFDRILMNTCRDRLRRRRRIAAIEVEAVADDGEPGRSVDPPEATGHLAALLEGLDRLSADERIAIALRYEADLTVPAIARVTGAREGTVKSRLHHALRKLREGMAEEAPR